MAIREILTVPDPRLREVSKEVPEVTDEIRALMDDMLETMYAAPGIGLAAIQVGEPLRIIVMDIAGKDEEPQPRYFVNPRIIDPAEETAPYEEGCLSVPDAYEELERPATCTVEYLDYEGKPQTLKAEGLLATCIQHEMDHLEGILFIDHLSRLKRERILKRLKREAKLKEKAGSAAALVAE
ncbi:peptide deformylase [Parvularcula lutaonensis]|uniref:Peptide deformylase n=1 Tax=Parvularcula lutaonensis TaxID=491923 RepID=A0ABV7MAF7_9PROT|nr:peptide deformylase [Parvularcula lutaonensis]GGY37534.1 peptide deformylase [Parvularcula lutaonensis]